MGLFGGRPRRKFATQAELAQQHLNEVTAARQRLLDEYKKNAPVYEQQQIGEARRSIAAQTKQNLNSLNTNANQRGLLFSGQRAASEGALKNSSNFQMASEKDAIAKRMKDYLEGQQADITNQQLGIQTQNQASKVQEINDSANLSARNYALNNQLMQAGGYAAGNYFGGGGQPAAQQTQQRSPYAGSYNNRSNSRNIVGNGMVA